MMLILQGLPGCGKSTYRRQLMELEPNRWVYINWDEMRGDNYKFSAGAERQIQKKSNQIVREALRAGKDVIIDNTNLNDHTLAHWKNVAAQEGHMTQIETFDLPIEECRRRDRERTGRARVGWAVIDRMALRAGMIQWDQIDKKLVLVDMDGTLADVEHRRHFVQDGKKHWGAFFANCDQDPPVDIVLRWVKALHESGEYLIVIVSGRPINQCGIKTEEWLYRYEVPAAYLFMRQSGDSRKDDLVKQDILDLLPKDKIAFTIDDRNQVVDMWRRNGLTCYQVAEGDF